MAKKKQIVSVDADAQAATLRGMGGPQTDPGKWKATEAVSSHDSQLIKCQWCLKIGVLRYTEYTALFYCTLFFPDKLPCLENPWYFAMCFVLLGSSSIETGPVFTCRLPSKLQVET